MVRAPDCGSGCRGFDSHLPPFLVGKSIACAMLFFVVSLLGDCRAVKGGRRCRAASPRQRGSILLMAERGVDSVGLWLLSLSLFWEPCSLLCCTVGAVACDVCGGSQFFVACDMAGGRIVRVHCLPRPVWRDSAVGLLGDLCCGCLGCVLAVSSPCGGASCVREVCCYTAGGGSVSLPEWGDKSKSGYPGGITALL